MTAELSETKQKLEDQTNTAETLETLLQEERKQKEQVQQDIQHLEDKIKVLFNVQGTMFELHECPVDVEALGRLGHFVTEEEALRLPFQLPSTGNHLYFTRVNKIPQLAVGVLRGLERPEDSARYAVSLMKMVSLLGPIKKGQMKGQMRAFGYRNERKTGVADCYVTKDFCRYQQESKTWLAFVECLQAALNKHFPCQALHAALSHLQYDTPTMSPLTPMGNLTVTFNFSVVLHKDKDVSWVIGRWYRHLMSEDESMGYFVFPLIGVCVPFEHGITIVWHSAEQPHATVDIPPPKSGGTIIGTSIQITTALACASTRSCSNDRYLGQPQRGGKKRGISYDQHAKERKRKRVSTSSTKNKAKNT